MHGMYIVAVTYVALVAVACLFCAGSYGAFANCWNDMCGQEMIPLGPTFLNFTKSKKEVEEKST